MTTLWRTLRRRAFEDVVVPLVVAAIEAWAVVKAARIAVRGDRRRPRR